MRLPFFHRYESILRNRNFLKLWLAQVSAKISENFLNFSLVIILNELTHSTFLVSVFIAVVAIPPILLSAYAGVIADSFNRRTILVTSNLLRVLLVLVVIGFAHHPTALIVIAFFIAVVAQFFSPAEVASIPSLVHKDQLFTANSFYSFTGYATFLIGYTLAGPMLSRFGDRATFVLAIVLYLIAAFLVSRLPSLVDHLKKIDRPEANPFRDLPLFWERLKKGLGFIRRHKVVLFVIIQIGIVFSIERGFVSLVPSFAKDVFHLTIEQISYFLILPTGLGAVAGVLVVNRFKHRVPKHRLINIGMILDGLALLLIALWPGAQTVLGSGASAIDPGVLMKWAVAALAFLSGFADPFIIIPAQTALHELTPDEERGRVFGALYTVINFLGIIPVLVIGAVAELVSMNLIILVLGSIILLAAVQGVYFYRRHRLNPE
jgi:MFS family permease